MMIRPTKHSHPDKTVTAVSATLLRYFKEKRSVSFEEARAHVISQDSSLDPIFPFSLDLLFLLGLIEYRPKNDTLEYVGNR